MGYPLNELYQEVATIALYFNWSREEILNLEHQERLIWLQQIYQLTNQ